MREIAPRPENPQGYHAGDGFKNLCEEDSATQAPVGALSKCGLKPSVAALLRTAGGPVAVRKPLPQSKVGRSWEAAPTQTLS